MIRGTFQIKWSSGLRKARNEPVEGAGSIQNEFKALLRLIEKEQLDSFSVTVTRIK